MGDADSLIRARIHYNGREKYFHGMQVAAVEGIRRFAGDPTFKFYYAMALVLEGRIQEGIRELDPLLNQPEVCPFQSFVYLNLFHFFDKTQLKSHKL